MKPIFVGVVLAVTVTASLHNDARSASRPGPGQLYNCIATKAFADGAEKFYLEKMASNRGRVRGDVVFLGAAEFSRYSKRGQGGADLHIQLSNRLAPLGMRLQAQMYKLIASADLSQ